MATVCKEGMCNGCGACAAVCPKECVTLNKTIYCYNAVIDKAKCVECEKCKKVCPNLNKIEMREPTIRGGISKVHVKCPLRAE